MKIIALSILICSSTFASDLEAEFTQKSYQQISLEQRLQKSLITVGFKLNKKQFGYALVDITNKKNPIAIYHNPLIKVYGASLPKLFIMATFFWLNNNDSAKWPITNTWLEKMTLSIRSSSNLASSELWKHVGGDNIEAFLRHPDNEFYILDEIKNPSHPLYRSSGLWVGQAYDGGRSVYRKDPISGLGHLAPPYQTARFLTKLAHNDLISYKADMKMKQIMSKTNISSKFGQFFKEMVQAIDQGLVSNHGFKYFRKSGTWQPSQSHLDASIVYFRGKKYVVVITMNDLNGKENAYRFIKAAHLAITGFNLDDPLNSQ